MKFSKTGLLAGMLSVAAFAQASPALAAPTVTVRIEGQNSTLLERTRVTLGPDPAPGNGCPGDSVAAAIEAGTRGNWDRQVFVSTILGETHKFDDSDYWAEWLDTGAGYKRGGGICDDRLKEGDDVVMLVDRSPEPTFAPTVFPLDVEGVPAQVQRGTAVRVTVVEYRSATGGTGEGERVPVSGARVAGGGAVATSAADGTATLRFERSGPTTVKATKQGAAPSGAENLTVTEPASSPGTGTGTAPAAPSAPTVAAPVRDTSDPIGRVLGIREKQVFTRARAPRELRIAASDPSGIDQVKLRLTRRSGGRCSYLSGRRDEFRRTRCGRAFSFKASEQAEFSYLIPERLGKGRYVLDVIAIDKAFNRDVLDRGRTRIVFTVR